MCKLKFLGRLLVLALFVAGAAVVAWRSGWLGRSYTATAQVLVEPLPPRILSREAEKYDPVEFENFRETQMQLFKSRNVLTAAVRDLQAKKQPSIEREDARHDAVEWLGRQIRVECPNPRTGIITISLTSRNPHEAAALVNAVVDAYMTEVVNHDRQLRCDRLGDLREISAEKENEVRTKREQLKRELETIGAGDDETMKARGEMAMRMYVEVLHEFQKMRAEKRLLLSKLTEVKKTLLELPNAEIPEAEVAMLLYNNPLYRDLQSRFMILEATNRYHDNAVLPGTNRPELVRSKAEYEATWSQLQDLERKSTDQVRAAKRIALETEKRRLESQVEIATDQLTALEKEVERKAYDVDSVGRISVAAQMARAEVATVERILHAVDEERETLRVELKSPSRVKVLGDPNAPAAVPECPD